MKTQARVCARWLILLTILGFLAGCGGEPAPTPDSVATQVAVLKLAASTLTAEAPTPTNTPTDTATPLPSATATATPTPTPTWTPTATWTATPTPTNTPTETPAATATTAPTKKPQPTKAPVSGNMLLYSSVELSQNDLFVIDSQGGSRKRLTTIGMIGRAQYTSDGKRITFDRVESQDPAYNSDIYVMNADGSGLTNLTHTTDWVELQPSWSPDGSRIVFQGRTTIDIDSNIYIMNADGSGRTLLTDHNNNNYCPTWSPDGARIVFVSYWEGRGGKWRDKGDIYRINANGSGLTNLTKRGESFAELVWSPNGQELVYGRLTRDRTTGESWQIWRMSANGANQRCIIGCVGNFSKFSNVPVAWRGTRIAFRGWKDGNWNVFIANDDGTGIVQLTSESFDQKTHDWQP